MTVLAGFRPVATIDRFSHGPFYLPCLLLPLLLVSHQSVEERQKKQSRTWKVKLWPLRRTPLFRGHPLKVANNLAVIGLGWGSTKCDALTAGHPGCAPRTVPTPTTAWAALINHPQGARPSSDMSGVEKLMNPRTSRSQKGLRASTAKSDRSSIATKAINKGYTIVS